MGRLKVLEVENFKSYSGRHIVGPFSDFACIIGPNGSGKSNMMDAISFVLGIQSKHLRSNHLKELLYRKDVDSLPARKASVKLVYQFDDDEVDGRRAGEEISLERTVSSSGVGAYRLGDKEVTFEVYDSFLQSIGVLTKVRNFLVFQGDVETVASKSPVELTKMFEQISGSDLLSSEYDELLKRKEEAEEAMQLAMQTKKMMSGQCRAAKGQKDEADEFLAKKDDLSQLKTELVMWQLWRIKSEMDENQKSIESLQDDAKVIELREAEILVETQSEKKEVAKFNKQLSAAEKDYASKRKLIDTVTPKLLEIRSNIKSTVKRIKDLEKSESNVRKDLENQQTTVEKLREEIALIQAEESTLKEKMKSANPFNVRLSDAQKAEYSRLREVVASRSAAARAEQLTAESQLKGLEQSLKQIENREDTLRQDLQMSEKAVEEYTERLQSLQKSIDLSKRDIAELLAAKDSSIRSAEKAESTLSDLGQELDGVEQKLRDAGDDRRRGKQEERMNEAIDTMQRIYKGVHGKLIDLCRPIQKKYSQAITVAAGKHMDAIVVDTKQVATDCMRYLKDQRVGTCLFLPLDNISVKPIPERYRTFGSKYRPCIDLIDCEENIKAAVSYAVGSTLVCDTLEEAQELCFQKNESVKVVTLRGHVINKSGAMTGGSVRENFQDRWEEKEVENLRKTKEDLLSKISEVNRSLPSRQQILDFDTKVRTKQSRLQFSESELRVIEQKLSQLEQQRAMKVEHAKKLEQEKVKMISAVRKQESKISELQEGIASVESVVFSEFSVSVGVENIREYEENSLKKHEQLLQKTNAATKQLASLTSQLEYEMKRDFSGSLKRVEEQVRNSRMNLEKLEEDEQAILQKELHVRQLAKEAQQQVDRLKQEKDKFDQTWRLLQAQRDEITNDRKLIMSKISKEELSIEGARAKLHEVLQKAEMDEVSLPTVEITSVEANQASSRSSAQDSDSSDDRESDLIWTGNRSASFSSQRQRAAGRSNKETEETEESFSSGSASRGTESTHFSKSSNPIVRKDSSKVAKVDLSEMHQYKNWSRNRIHEAEINLAKEIADLTLELDAMQPNMHAEKMFNEVMEQYKGSSAEVEEKRELAAEILSKFEKVKQERQSLFQDCFTKVSEALGVIYRDLTRSSKHPLGGNAYLTLDNTDEPYLGGVRFTAMPPMKRFRDMEQLSGGEKTMAALALLFSIHSYRPAPFFVMDEVDAALDNVNVKKICNYIKQRSKDFQCVVISLKEMFFQHADCLVGICKDRNTMSSAVLTLDLTTYDDNPLDQGDDLSAAGSQKYSETYSNSQINSPAVSAIGRAARKSSGLSSTSDERKLSGGSKPSSGSGSVDYQAKRKRGKASVRASVGRRQIHSDVAIETVSEGEEEED